MSFIVPIPPNPDDNQYKGNPLSLARGMFDWALKTKGRLEQSKPLANGVAVTTPAAGDMPYYANNLGWTRLAGGSPGQVLTYGTSTAPTWGNISSNLASGTGILVTGTATDTLNTSFAAGTGITITGTATQTFASSAVGTAGGYLSGTYPNPNVTKVLGVSTSGNASAGDVGEYISSTVVSTSAAALSSGTTANVTSIVLTPGDWDVAGNTAFIAGALTTATIFAGGIGTSAATLPASPGAGAFSQFGISVSAGGVEPCFSVGETRLSLAGTSTAYLVAQATFATSTMGAYGFIGARRRR